MKQLQYFALFSRVLALTAALALGRTVLSLGTRQDGSNGNADAAASSISSYLSSPAFVPYTLPTEKVQEWIALGDSYTSGVGANGWQENFSDAKRGRRSYALLMSYGQAQWLYINGDPNLPRFSWHAYTGDKTWDVVDKQLTTGIYRDDYRTRARGQPFGSPQIAVLTIGGNDAKLSKLINACILRAIPKESCGSIIAEVQVYIDSNKFQYAVENALFQIGIAGRRARGANPPESFQIFLLGYLEFFNEVDTACDGCTLSLFAFDRQYLTTDLRKRLNALAVSVNTALKAAADDLKAFGAIYVEPPSSAYNGHRFCEPGHADNEMVDAATWFWSPISDIYTSSEGPGDPTDAYPSTLESNDTLSNAQALMNFYFPGRAYDVATLSAWPADIPYVDFDDLLAAMGNSSDPTIQALLFRLTRMFHPKGTAYQQHFLSVFQAIAENRNVAVGSAPAGPSNSTGQQLALATYIDPGANPDTWSRLIAFPADKVSVLVANVANGPDSSANAGWTDVIPKAAASGKKVLGYVRTGYLGVSQQQFTTRLGSSKTSDWVAQIQEDVDQWYRLYPGIGGIFFDEGWNDCGANNINADLYKFITQSTKRKYANAFTVLNPGAPMPQCFEQSADTLLTAEVSYSTYTSGFIGNNWTPSDPRKIWHIVYNVPAGQGPAVAALALQRGAGLLHITDDGEPNPYDTVPDDTYMQGLMNAVAGGTPLNEGIFPWPNQTACIESAPGFFAITSFDYSSATFSWPAATCAVGYRIYQNSVAVLSLTPTTMTTVTVGGLTPESSYTFWIVAINTDGTESGPSDTISMSTLALPSGGRTNTYDTACCQYMVEGGTLYRYTGTYAAGVNMPWSWTLVGAVPVVQSGYDWTWTVPIGTSTIDTTSYFIQVQGYGPKFNVYHPCPWITGLLGPPLSGEYCL